jgi:serine/threonine protein phosphatase 1
MSDSIAFVGDVHGNRVALEALVWELSTLGVDSIVLLGDYINKGPDGAGVIQYIVSREGGPKIVPLLGNHEAIFLQCMESGDVRPLLRMSGAPTIRSYVGGPVGPDVFADLRSSVPKEHLDFLKRLPSEYVTEDIIASHFPQRRDHRFRISAHVTVGVTPRILAESAEIDTGCGSGCGRLTGLLWPSRHFIQIDEVAPALRVAT